MQERGEVICDPKNKYDGVEFPSGQRGAIVRGAVTGVVVGATMVLVGFEPTIIPGVTLGGIGGAVLVERFIPNPNQTFIHDGSTYATPFGAFLAGAATGGVIGGVAGGPLGLGIGAIGGGFIGLAAEKKMHPDW